MNAHYIMLGSIVFFLLLAAQADAENPEKSILTRVCVKCPTCGHEWCTNVTSSIEQLTPPAKQTRETRRIKRNDDRRRLFRQRRPHTR